VLSLPIDRDAFSSDIINSYRVKQGVLHNPRSDRRTTQGIFHVTEGGLPIPDDKLGVPQVTFAKNARARTDAVAFADATAVHVHATQPGGMFRLAFDPPAGLSRCAGVHAGKTMEIRFFVPGNLVSNLDFIESIFGNGNDPLLPENDSALDTEHWTGHTAASSSHRTSSRPQKIRRPAAMEGRDRTPAARRHVLEGRERNLQ